MSRLRLTAFLSALIATSVVLVLAIGPTFSAIPHSTNKKYYACFAKKGGAVRLIHYPKVSKCKKGERLRTWNAKGRPGATGPAGPQGPAGPAGTAGITKIHLTRVVSDPPVAIPANDNGFAIVKCDAGKVVGGGFGIQDGADMKVYDSSPIDANTWGVAARNNENSSRQLTAYAICMTTEPGAVIASTKSTYATASKKAFRTAKKKGKKKRR